MGLATYRKKRRFDRTPEPEGKDARTRGTLRFVVQKHAASRLHYDFRLELDGVLKSWAVPKGPSLNPDDKRLAVMVEDHPFDYRTFEGTIPEGNYGAGTVMVWDKGTYHATGSEDRRESEQLLRDGLAQGHISFVLHGNKLKGEFSLVKLKRGKGNDWLLIKKHDEFASEQEITQEDRSVSTGRSLDQITRGAKAGRHAPTAKAARDADDPPPVPAKALAPGKVKPMLATLVQEPFDRPGWLFEVKWDGYRAIAEVRRRGVAFYSRNHHSFVEQFAPLVDSLRKLDHEAILDGEVVVVDDRGRSHFQLLQNYRKTGRGRLLYYVFDLLALDGHDLRKLPLVERKAKLARILGSLPDILLSEHIDEHGIAFFNAAREQGLEGIMAKDGRSPYREGRRGLEWLKVKTHSRQEAVIGGFTEPRGRRKNLGALLLGVYDGGDFTYIGHAGGGFDTEALADLRARLDPLVTGTCPFQKKPKPNAPVRWVTPQLVCEVSFQEWTDDGIMRQPIFLGLRDDKPARQVRRELAQTPASPTTGHGRSRAPKATRSHATPRTTRSSADSHHQPDPSGIALTNLEKVYWPTEGYTKGDLIDYYRQVAPVLLPYLLDRPESLHRHPDGIDGKSFFQKNVSHQPPPAGVETVSIRSESDGKNVRYLLCQNLESLLYLVNLGCIELNPWISRVENLHKPDFLVIDLDPEDASFAQVIAAAVAVHKILDRVDAMSLCKTSGKRGLHICVPLGARYDFDQAKEFARLIALQVNQALPAITSIVRSPVRRQGRVYLDFLQNRIGQTLAAPYCVRPYPGATVSTPLAWTEVKKGLDPSRFTIQTVPRRLDKTGDLWSAVAGPGIDLGACLERLAEK